MESMLKMFAFLLLCCLCSGEAGGDASCPLSSIVVTQSGTGGWAHGQPVYAVAVRNTCRCAQSDVRVACGGFVTTLAVDPSKLRPIGDGLCLVNGGGALVRGRDVTFSYASEKQFGFGPVSSTVAC